MSAKMEGPPVTADLPPNPPAGEATYKAEVHQGTSACGPTFSAARGPEAALRKELRPLKWLSSRGSPGAGRTSVCPCIPVCIHSVGPAEGDWGSLLPPPPFARHNIQTLFRARKPRGTPSGSLAMRHEALAVLAVDVLRVCLL